MTCDCACRNVHSWHKLQEAVWWWWRWWWGQPWVSFPCMSSSHPCRPDLTPPTPPSFPLPPPSPPFPPLPRAHERPRKHAGRESHWAQMSLVGHAEGRHCRLTCVPRGGCPNPGTWCSHPRGRVDHPARTTWSDRLHACPTSRVCPLCGRSSPHHPILTGPHVHLPVEGTCHPGLHARPQMYAGRVHGVRSEEYHFPRHVGTTGVGVPWGSRGGPGAGVHARAAPMCDT